MAASVPWALRAEKSDMGLPWAAHTHRAALVANRVCRLIWLMMNVSASWASIIGPLTSSTGSSVKNNRPSGMARTDPVKRKPARYCRKSPVNMPVESRYSRAAGPKLNASR